MIKSPTIKPNNLILPGQFVKESLAELKKVVWPSKQQLIKLTVMVIIVSIITGAIIGGFDYLFTEIVGKLIK